MLTKGFLLASLIAVVLTYPAIQASAVGVGQTCGTIANIKCDRGLWCDPEPGKCGGADLAGVCVSIPPTCPKEIRQVCGCNKKNYNGDCPRWKARVAKNHDGACRTNK